MTVFDITLTYVKDVRNSMHKKSRPEAAF